MGHSSGFSSAFLDYFTSDLHICNSQTNQKCLSRPGIVICHVCLLENSHCLAGCKMLHQGRLSRKSQLKHCNRWHQLYFLLPVDQVRLFGPLNLMNPHIWDHRIRVLNIRGMGTCFRVSACRTNTLFGSLSILGRSGAWRIAVVQKVLASPMMQIYIKAWFSEAAVLYQKRRAVQ